MSETTPFLPGLMPESETTDRGFQSILDYIREISTSQYRKGVLFERLMREYFQIDPIYKQRFTDVWLWKEWAELKGLDRTDRGIDLVAQEREGGACAIQCKCYSPTTRISKRDLDSFIAESSREIYTSRIVIDTGGEWGSGAVSAIEGLSPACNVIRFGDLANRPIDWPDLSCEDPEQLKRQEPFSLRQHQQEAFHDVVNGFNDSDRGKMIMACGTGKTFTALRIAEKISGIGGRVLYLVPSIGLFSQAMREWAEQQEIPHRYIGICSDASAGRQTEDAPIQELEIPVTTETEAITEALQHTDEAAMTVVFCTYHSLPIVETAQDQGAPAFDIILCDEAHRTTGIESPEDKTQTSPFVLVHNADRIRAKKRLYMTATSRLYTESARVRAAHHDREVFSMDDPEIYGPEFHRLPFSKAVEKGLLSDYKVVVLALYEPGADSVLQRYIGTGGSNINITDATKIIGCWRVLQNPEGKSGNNDNINPLRRVIAFNNTIANSKRLVQHWNELIESAIEHMPEDQRPVNFKCETRHVDGKDKALERKSQIEWLKNDTDSVCHILSNARCLSEGIDVPALDAVIFMTRRDSHVDIVQAVGRVMRKVEGKEYGYIVLPVAIPAGTDATSALNNNKHFATVWNVLRALRSHDDRFNAEINKIDLNKSHAGRIIFIDGDDDEGEQDRQEWIPFDPVDIPPEAIFAKIVEQCGDRKYWESWAEDVADIFNRVVDRIKNLLNNSDNDALCEKFDNFHADLQGSINASITRNDAIDMMAQHILTLPVFEALFENYDFASGNPVSIALDSLRKVFEEFGLGDETRDLEGFYESVQMRARGIDNSEGRQSVLLELYEKFFQKALKKEAERLGMVYTPKEVVDFILYSADEVLQNEFGRSLSDEGVHILDPFAGAGIFLVRLLQSGFIQSSDLKRKYREELHANEIVLLAYYIAAVNIEEAYYDQREEDSGYEPFNGIVLTDTFNLNKKGEPPTLFPKEWLPGNNTRAEHQQNQKIEVIVGNPPWKAKQRNAADENPNVNYPALRTRIERTYGKHTTVQNRNSLYDSYKMAIRWASDRIKEQGQKQGVVAFVTNGSWIDGNVDAGVRACLAKEFSSIYVLNLRGDAHTSGEKRRSEGGNVFGDGSRSSVAITILVKNPNAAHSRCRILYRDIGDYLNRDEKLMKLHEAVSISGFSDWQEITPDGHYDWIRQRSDAFQQFYPLGSKDTQTDNAGDTILRLYSQGLKTGRDKYIYNFTRDTCAENARRMTQGYLNALREREDNPQLTVDEAARRHSSNIKWDRELKNNLKRKKKTKFEENYIRKALYRPFVATNCYADYTFAQMKYQIDRIFPNSLSENRVICVPGIGNQKPFSALMTDTMPDLNLNEAGAQCFPRYCYPKPPDTPDTPDLGDELPGIELEPERIDNISDTALNAFREHYCDDAITKDAIFDYIYGVLHAPSYREQFPNDLSKELPHIPFAPDFHTFAEAGSALAALHIGYETCEQYPLDVVFAHEGEPQPSHFLLRRRAMDFADEKTVIIINDHVSLSGIPEEAHRYVVNGRTPLEWFIDRYKVTRDTDSDILNDPNGWFEDPRDLVTAIERIVYVSVESTRIIEGLPIQLIDSSEG